MCQYLKGAEVIRQLQSKFGVSRVLARRMLTKGRVPIRCLRLGPKTHLYMREDTDRLIRELEQQVA